MDQLTRTNLQTLAEVNSSTCVSLYMPTIKSGREIEQGRIHLKNTLKAAEEQLSKNGVGVTNIRELLKKGHDLVDDSYFWHHQDQGLAVFLAPDFFQSFRLPQSFEEFAVVNDRFHLKPLLPFLSGNGQFFVVALNQKALKLYEGTRHSIDEIPLEHMPTSLAEALQIDEMEKHLNFHTRSSGQRGDRDAMFHGQGPGGEDNKKLILQYFQRIDKGLHEFLRESTQPLVLAGVEYYFPIFREACTYRHLLDEGVVGSANNMKAEELHAQAWPLVKDIFEKPERDAIARFYALSGNGKTATRLEEILPAAHDGRVETLLVDLREPVWGRYDAEKKTVEVHDNRQTDDEDMIDLSAVKTFLSGGNVFTTIPDKISNESKAGAILRY